MKIRTGRTATRNRRDPMTKLMVEYWSRVIDDIDMGCEWHMAYERCWACGYNYNLEKAHIIADAHGGDYIPENLVLLCGDCHDEAPCNDSVKAMWDYIAEIHRNTGEWSGDVPPIRNGKTLERELDFIKNRTDDVGGFVGRLLKKATKFSIHAKFHKGRRYTISNATWVAAARECLKEMKV